MSPDVIGPTNFPVKIPSLVMDHPGCPTRTKAPLREQLGEGWLITDTTARHVDENRLQCGFKTTAEPSDPCGRTKKSPLFFVIHGFEIKM